MQLDLIISAYRQYFMIYVCIHISTKLSKSKFFKIHTLCHSDKWLLYMYNIYDVSCQDIDK